MVMNTIKGNEEDENLTHSARNGISILSAKTNIKRLMQRIKG